MELDYLLFILAIYSISVFWLGKKYFRSKKVIRMASNAIYPTVADDTKGMRTPLGKLEGMTFCSKNWKNIRRLSYGVMLFITLGLLVAFRYHESLNLFNALFFFIYPVMFISVYSKIPSFFVVEGGFYLDEKFYNWSTIEAVKIDKVRMGDHIYGMFEGASEYSKVTFVTGKRETVTMPKEIYVLETTQLEKLRKVFQGLGVKELCETTESKKIK
ncbi:hypothetical protein KS419_19325 [Bacillus tamaricis]|uniref:Uncharacterized protein n=2 Tax=Evansella tamaricis TaxID=2069301 RepID=A0ABS6JJQ5_9BACI|nr:hypothetical protein [Evansella tamaricis]MBU9713886.1 hypothetical protein [Evansella tamaricis]